MEYVIVAAIVAAAAGYVVLRIVRGAKGRTCHGCSSACQSDADLSGGTGSTPPCARTGPCVPPPRPVDPGSGNEPR